MDSQSSWAGLKVLITGASGFLGSHLCARVLELGAEVHATSRVPRASVPGGPCWWHSSLLTIESVREILSKTKPDVIYHMAGSVGASPNLELVLPAFHSLLTSTVNLLVGAKEIGCHRVILSGSLTEPSSQGEESTPSSPYAAAKWAASGYGRMFYDLYKLPTVMVTPFMTFGPRQDSRKLIPSVILSLLEKRAAMLSSGQWEADWIYVDDVIQGFLAAAVVPGIEGRTVELGTGMKRSIREVAELIAQLMNNPAKLLFGAIADRPNEPVRVADTMDAQLRLGWSAKTSFSQGLRQTIQWYEQQAAMGRA